MTKRTLLIIGALILAGPAWACLNDRDTTTLADVAGKFPNAVQVITGRFPRNPPLYYEMRIKRITDDLKRNPNLLPEYDDIAVACDRVSRDDDAIAWMDKKRARMLALHTAGGAPNSGDTPWYRYYANNGTFWVHRYMHSGGKRPLSAVETAQSLIQKAIEVYPGAHYGRERFQVYAMDWMMSARYESMGECLVRSTYEDHDTSYNPNRDKSKVDGISGIIVLGAGWESVDMFDGLAEAFRWHRVRNSPIAVLADLRVDELLRAGKRSGWPGHPFLHYSSAPSAPVATHEYWSTESNYVRLRKEAEEWQAKRTAYMMERLQAGRHPNTDPTFWAEYKESPAPPIYNAPWFVRAWWAILNMDFFGAIAVVTIGCILFYLGVRKIAIRTGRNFGWGSLLIVTLFIWAFLIAILFPMFAKARG